MKCLNTFSQILFLFALSGCAANKIIDFDNAATLSNPDKYLAFVGEKIQIVEFDPAEDDPESSEEDDEDTIIIHMDSAYKARYRILELVHGGYGREIVDFKVYDHYGFPTFAESNVAMLYLTEYDGALYHVKYLFDIVHPTSDGRYAYCGSPYTYLEDIEEVDRRPLKNITFLPPVVLKITDYLIDEDDYEYYTEEEIAENQDKAKEFFSKMDFDLNGDMATCKRGVYPDELFRIMNETILLPRRRKQMCEESLELEDYYSYDSDEAKAVKACVDNLKSKGLP